MFPNAIQTRRHDVDWLRILAFGLLIYFHTAVAFLPGGLPLIHNDEVSVPMIWFVAFLQEFRLPLLFLVSGIGVFFALRSRDRAAFFQERSRRLLVPLAFGIVVLVPPMVFLEKRFLEATELNFLQFYVQIPTGIYPQGDLSWHHFWFVAYLFLFCVLGWPIFSRWRSPDGAARLQQRAAWLTHGYRLYWPVALLFAVEVPLRWLFPGFRDLIHDWASFSQWFVIFCMGFVLATHQPLLDRCQTIRWSSLLVACAASAALFGGFFDGVRVHVADDVRFDVETVTRYVAFCGVRVVNTWAWLLTCLGFAGAYLQRPGRVLSYLNRAIYPLFCVHLPVMVAFEYVIIPQPWSISAKYLSIVAGTAIGSLACYELARRLRWLGTCLGLQPRAPAAA